MVAFSCLAAGYLFVGRLSQKMGRRRFMIAAGLWAATVGTTFYYLLLSLKPSALVAVIALVTLTVLSVNACWGMITAYINERFHTGARASGFGLGYSLAVILPSFYAGYQDLLSRVMDTTYTPLPLLVIGGLLIVTGAILGPETRDVDLATGDDVGEAGGSRALRPLPPRARAGRRGERVLVLSGGRDGTRAAACVPARDPNGLTGA